MNTKMTIRCLSSVALNCSDITRIVQCYVRLFFIMKRFFQNSNITFSFEFILKKQMNTKMTIRCLSSMTLNCSDISSIVQCCVKLFLIAKRSFLKFEYYCAIERVLFEFILKKQMNTKVTIRYLSSVALNYSPRVSASCNVA